MGSWSHRWFTSLGPLAIFAACLFGMAGRAEAAQGVNEGCSAFKPCGSGLSCIPFRQVCHRDSGAQDGEACQAGYGCANGLTCEAGSQVCRGPAKSGEACHLTRPCGAGLSCQPGVQKCFADPRAEGEPCSAGFGCGPGLQCEAGSQVCRASGKVGDACHLTRPCGAGLSCQPGVQRCYHDPRQTNEPCVAGFGCAAGLLCTAGKQVCEARAAKQCVRNMAPYSAKVEWWKPQDVIYDEKTKALTLAPNAKALQTDDNVTVGFSSCNSSSDMRTAIVRIKGAKIANDAITKSVSVVVGAAVAVGGVVACVGTVGAGCVGLAVAAVALPAAIDSISTGLLPDPQEIGYVGAPTTTQEVSFKGTIWEPYWEYGALRGGPAAHRTAAPDAAKAECKAAIQDKVAWSRGGSKRWQEANLEALCQGAINPVAIASCVTDAITAHNNWSRAIADCKGR